MKPLYTLALVIVAGCLGATTAVADAMITGMITTLNTERSQWNISIDTRDLTLTAGTEIQNLDTPGTGSRGIKLQQQVRYRANKRGEITELWILPSDPETRRQLGLESAQDRAQ